MKEYILSEDLAVWFGKKKKKKGSSQPKGPWVNICKKKKGGGHPPCGRKDADEGAYPVCRAAGVAGKMSQSEKDSACRRKREKEKKDPQSGKGQKPTRIKIKNYKNKKKNESIDRLIGMVLEREEKMVISEELQYHLDNKINISENVFRYGSPKYFEVINEARELYKKGYGQWSEEDIEILESERGKFFIYNGERLPLDFPMVNEGGADTSWTSADNETITLQDILDLTKNIETINLPTEKLATIVLNWDDNPEEIERISQVEVSTQYPILVMVDEQNRIQWILDGNHRAQQALRANAETIPTKLIKPSNLNSKARKILLGIIDEANLKGTMTFRNWTDILQEGKGEEIDDTYFIIQSLKTGSPKYMANIEGEKPLWVPDSRIRQAYKFATLDDAKNYISKFNPKKTASWHIYKRPYDLNPKDVGLGRDFTLFNEAEYKGKKVELNKPKSGGPKKWYVYVRNPKTGKIKKVTYGSPVMTAKWNDPAARKSFAARHQCHKKKDKTKAGYWACRAHKDFGKNVSGRYW